VGVNKSIISAIVKTWRISKKKKTTEEKGESVNEIGN